LPADGGRNLTTPKKKRVSPPLCVSARHEHLADFDPAITTVSMQARNCGLHIEAQRSWASSWLTNSATPPPAPEAPARLPELTVHPPAQIGRRDAT